MISVRWLTCEASQEKEFHCSTVSGFTGLSGTARRKCVGNLAFSRSHLCNRRTQMTDIDANMFLMRPNQFIYYGSVNTVYVKTYHAVGLKVATAIYDEVTGFFNWPNPFSHTNPWDKLSLTETSTRNFPFLDNAWTSHNTAASTACYVDSFTSWRRSVRPVRYELDCKYCYK
jgi:hypothetical protein